jgi:hypothetical protein
LLNYALKIKDCLPLCKIYANSLFFAKTTP